VRAVALAAVVLGFVLAPLLFDEDVATWSDLLPRTGLRASARTHDSRSVLAIDDAGQTVWSGRCENGDWLRIELGRLVPVTALVVDHGQLQENHPRQLDVALVGEDGTRRRDTLEPARRRFRMWQAYRAEEPVVASAVLLRPSLNLSDASQSGRWDVRDVRIRTTLERSFDASAYVAALRGSLVPLACALALAWLLTGRPRPRGAA
jgi:hypothetical protein